MILSRFLLLLLLVPSCTTPPAEPDDALPASPLARAALAEWEAWGRIITTGWPETRPADTAASPERLRRLLDYWATVSGGAAIAHWLSGVHAAITAMRAEPNSTERVDADGPAGSTGVDAHLPEDIGLYAYPAWSAAFISAVARRANVPQRDLPSSLRHSRYIDTALATALTDSRRARFQPYAPEEWAPRPGDLLCADRSAAPLAHWSQRLSEAGRPRPMHCDVVVRTGAGVVEAVGGNVQDMVVLRRFPADEAGRVLPAPSGQPPFFLVLADQDED